MLTNNTKPDPMRFSILLLLALVIAGCDKSEPEAPGGGAPPRKVIELSSLPYDLTKPTLKVELPDELVEISGLSYIAPDLLACVQDEDGKIFHVDLSQGQVVANYEFGKDGDYEGIEVLGDTCWILRGDGDLYEIQNYTQAEPIAEKFENALSKDNNLEGLGYDPKHLRLLLACKGDPGKGKGEYKGTKSIYAFDVSSKSLGATPLYAIRVDEISQALGKPQEATGDPESEEGKISFKPSGVAVHPRSGDIYVLASVGKLLVTLSPEGILKNVTPLPAELFTQPEGICFNPSGDLFVSNEGDAGKANILKFTLIEESK